MATFNKHRATSQIAGVLFGCASIISTFMLKVKGFLLKKVDFTLSTRKTRKRGCYMFNLDRFKEACVRKGIKVNYLETRIGLYHGYFNNVKSGKVRMTPDILNRTAIILDTTPEYLTGKTDDPFIPPDGRTGIKIKIFGEVAAGIPIKQIDNFDPEDADSWEEIDRRTAKNGTYFALKIKGDSMEPRIFDGDTVIVRYQDTIESGETAVVAINGDEATCKKVTLTADGLVLTANNPKYTPRFFSNEAVQKLPIRILGKVVEVRGKI